MDSVDRWPIVYSPQYNVKFCGFEKLHPFDAAKWGKVVQFLIEESLITNHSIYEPSEIGTDDLLQVHTKRYLNSLNWSYKVAYVVEMPLVSIIPNYLIQKLYLKSMRFQVGGSVLAGKLALEKGWSINVGGGFHHCSGDKGGGYCPYADITLLLHELFENHENVRKAMIVDLDAHQGNGHETDFKGDRRVYIMDVYNANLYPHDDPAKEAIHCQVELENHIPDSEYLPLVEKNLEKSLSSFHPDIIVYNAGTDILEGDPLGKLSITPEVDKLALENQVKERRMNEQQERMYEDVVQKNLVFYSEQAVQQEQLVKCLSIREAELHRQLENKLLAQEQRSRINRMNEAAFSNIPTNDYYSYFNTSSR